MTHLHAHHPALGRFVSSLTSNVFAVAGLPEEVIAATFARYSRSSLGLREMLSTVLAENEVDPTAIPPPIFDVASDKAKVFHERFTAGYGHRSVAEGAALHLAAEGISIVASKALEDARLASFIEKSTRFVIFDRGSIHVPAEFVGEAREVYLGATNRLFDTYARLVPEVMAYMSARHPRAEGQTEGGHTSAIRAQACDAVRGLLPAGTITNVSISANARTVEALISKLLSSPLEEVRVLGSELLTAALTVTPTLVKYAVPNAYRIRLLEVSKEVQWEAEKLGTLAFTSVPVRLLSVSPEPEVAITTALAFEGSGDMWSATEFQALFRAAPRSKLLSLLAAALGGRGPHDAPPRAFEAVMLTFELELDYGAYRDLQRHRLLSPSTRRLTPHLGWEMPALFEEVAGPRRAEWAEAYMGAVDGAFEAFDRLEETSPWAAQYVVPLIAKTRMLLTLNLRELIHIIELRSKRQGHPSYRKIAQGLGRETIALLPWIEPFLRVDWENYALTRGGT